MDHTISIIDFSTLSNEEKINLFQKNQNLLIKYKPESEFVIRNIESSKSRIVRYYLDIIKNYKGKVAIHQEFLLFFHIMQINDFEDVSEFATKRQSGDFSESGNCLFVEYIVGDVNLVNFKDLEDYFKDKSIEMISYVKHEQVKSVDFKKYKREILKASFSRS